MCKACGHKFGSKEVFEIDFKKDVNYVPKNLLPRDWELYTYYQNFEKRMFMQLLDEICSLIESHPIRNPGRPNLESRDMIFALCLKIFTKVSSRRLHSDLEFAHKDGFIESIPNYTTLMKFMQEMGLTPILQELIKVSALPIRQHGQSMAMDATGFSTSQFGRWFNHRYGTESEKRIYLKCHAMIEVRSNTVVSVEVTPSNVADTTQFEELLTRGTKYMDVKEVSADKGYLSRQNVLVANKLGVQAFIPFKVDSKRKKSNAVWKQMFDWFQENRQEYLEHYHERSNVESTFAMIKQKFGGSLMTRNFVSQTNEILAKVLCHNITCLVRAYYEKKLFIEFQQKPLNQANLAIQA